MSDFQLLPQLALAYPNIDPVLFSLGPLQVHWYGLAYVAGILLGWWYARRLVSSDRLWANHTPPLTTTDIDDFVVWAVAGVILGGRLGYVLFYDLPVYLDNPAAIFQVWNGGMSFHGGVAGTIIAMILFARSRGFSPYNLFDTVTASVGFGIFFGRIANFINGELFGKPTDLPWAMVFPNGGPDPRHPSQLYEATLEGLIMFIILRMATHRFLKLKHPGFVAGLFIFWYGISRILVEFVRLPDEQLGYLAGGWLTMGMVLSIPLVLIGVWGMASAPGRAPK